MENILHIWTVKLEEGAKMKGMFYIFNPIKDFGPGLFAHTWVSHVICDPGKSFSWLPGTVP